MFVLGCDAFCTYINSCVPALLPSPIIGTGALNATSYAASSSNITGNNTSSQSTVLSSSSSSSSPLVRQKSHKSPSSSPSFASHRNHNRNSLPWTRLTHQGQESYNDLSFAMLLFFSLTDNSRVSTISLHINQPSSITPLCERKPRVQIAYLRCLCSIVANSTVQLWIQENNVFAPTNSVTNSNSRSTSIGYFWIFSLFQLFDSVKNNYELQQQQYQFNHQSLYSANSSSQQSSLSASAAVNVVLNAEDINAISVFEQNIHMICSKVPYFVVLNILVDMVSQSGSMISSSFRSVTANATNNIAIGASGLNNYGSSTVLGANAAGAKLSETVLCIALKVCFSSVTEILNARDRNLFSPCPIINTSVHNYDNNNSHTKTYTWSSKSCFEHAVWNNQSAWIGLFQAMTVCLSHVSAVVRKQSVSLLVLLFDVLQEVSLTSSSSAVESDSDLRNNSQKSLDGNHNSNSNVNENENGSNSPSEGLGAWYIALMSKTLSSMQYKLVKTFIDRNASLKKQKSDVNMIPTQTGGNSSLTVSASASASLKNSTTFSGWSQQLQQQRCQ
jgi:hypothetical protein